MQNFTDCRRSEFDSEIRGACELRVGGKQQFGDGIVYRESLQLKTENWTN